MKMTDLVEWSAQRLFLLCVLITLLDLILATQLTYAEMTLWASAAGLGRFVVMSSLVFGALRAHANQMIGSRKLIAVLLMALGAVFWGTVIFAAIPQ